LIAEGLGPLAYARYHLLWPQLAALLQADRFSAAGEMELHQQKLTRIGTALVENGLHPVILKGAALAVSVYPEPSQRTMSDVDLMLPEAEMEAAVAVMVALGYRQQDKTERPLALQEMAGGEIQFYDPQGRLVELHWSPFAGWWVKRTATIDEAAIWQRVEPLSPLVDQLDPEDTVIHLAFHLAINHHFYTSAIRGLIDIAFTAQKRTVNWEIVAERAKSWRIGTAVYVAFDLAAQLVGVDGIALAREQLRPSALRRWLIKGLVRPETVLTGRDLSRGWYRYLLLLLLTDRLCDMVWLVWRTLWPEREWLAARYGKEQVSWWQHIGYMLRYRQI
jgi:hypothetical protein